MLVDHFWLGSVNLAASEMGLSQPTLNRIVSGTTLSPRSGVLQRIAAGGMVSVDWLLTGKGAQPSFYDENGDLVSLSQLRLRRIVDRIGATGGLRRALLNLGYGPLYAARSAFHFTEMVAAFDASDACADAWADLLGAAVGSLGVEHVRRMLQGNEVAAALGFSPFASTILHSKANHSPSKSVRAFYEAVNSAEEDRPDAQLRRSRLSPKNEAAARKRRTRK